MRHVWLYSIAIVLAIILGVIVYSNRVHAPAVAPVVPGKPETIVPAKKGDLILLNMPLPGTKVTSPLTVIGKARGNWYFEGSFPVILVDWDGKIIGQGIAKAQSNWMTSDYVPFKGTVTFTRPDVVVNNRGSLILKKDNPSGDPSKDDALEVEVRY